MFIRYMNFCQAEMIKYLVIKSLKFTTHYAGDSTKETKLNKENQYLEIMNVFVL